MLHIKECYFCSAHNPYYEDLIVSEEIEDEVAECLKKI